MRIDEYGEVHPIFSEFIDITPVGQPEEIRRDKRKETIQERFSRERQEWEEVVKDLAKRIRDINSIAELQVDVYSARQKLVEYYHYLTSLIGTKNKEIKKKWRARSEFYITGYDYKLDSKQREAYIRIDLEDHYIIRDEMENHMNYIGATMSTVDNIIFGIKHRITLEEYRRQL